MTHKWPSWDHFWLFFGLGEHSHMTSDVFWIFLTYLPTGPNQIFYYIFKLNEMKIFCMERNKQKEHDQE